MVLTAGRPWATAPFALIETPLKKAGRADLRDESGAFCAANEMALVHNMIIRGLNSVYLQAPNVREAADVRDFLTYMRSWSLCMHKHHDGEEEVSFPLLEQMTGTPDHMAGNIDQHKLLGPGLQAYDDYVAAVQAGDVKYDGARVRQIIDAFAPVLTLHLSEEITTLLDLDRLGDKIDWVGWSKKVQENAVAKGDKEFELPWAMANLDVTQEGDLHRAHWPPFPWFVGMIIRWIHYPRHRGAWRFGSCDSYGHPQDLPFA